jgi:hypothetical protein
MRQYCAEASVGDYPGNEWEVPLLGSKIKWFGYAKSGNSHF